MKRIMLLFASLTILLSCSNSEDGADAYGNFEAIETIVSAETGGKLLALNLTEVEMIEAGAVAAIVDTTLLALQKQELLAGRAGVSAKRNAADAQLAVLNQKLANLETDLKRVSAMHEANAATDKQLDDIIGGKKVLQKQIRSAAAQQQAVQAELSALDAKKALLDEQIRRSVIINPVSGTVLEQYAERFEMTAPGKPLYKIANLQDMRLKVYVSGGQLQQLKIGTDCTVLIDDADNFIRIPGTISWISSQAEFTPKIIQTKEERVKLVYAVKIRIRNDGAVKIGMPGEVIFSATE